jgi:AraC-like DNA-binding protein
VLGRLVKQANDQNSEVEIREYASLRQYQFKGAGFLVLEAASDEVLLLCVKNGHLVLQASFIPHPLEVSDCEAIFLAFPRGSWQVRLIHQPDTEVFMIRMDVARLHTLIQPSFNTQKLATANQRNMRDLMRLIPVSPTLMSCFDQIVHHKIHPPFNALYEQAKFLEIFSLIMESVFSKNTDACPVLMSPAIENKIHHVRRHIISNLQETPDPDHLAVIYELPRNTLKEGYRYLYGKTIHQYHADHKIEAALQMLAAGELLVKEIAFKIGYQNPSHFIAAFKKKYGCTPKQYLRQVDR